ncbi:hypothetical protein GGP41_003008 [Bipolaris sorokiniana]|uniref:Uncharacterized protein n=1 Tax=Cochliobolus sativus TaxID=45130 RepID=A0A8H5Z8C2_COCSA|nr:hypothetical protein GGP41_003008 [Bipolaris sorokiniana]
MIEAFKDMKHGKSSSYDSLALERTASQILHRIEDKDSEYALESIRTRVLGTERARDLWTESILRRDKLRSDFLKKSWSVHRRTQSIQ